MYGDDLLLVDDYARPWFEISALVKVVGKSTIELAPIDILGGTETKICRTPIRRARSTPRDPAQIRSEVREFILSKASITASATLCPLV
jgi:hypothetical protein